ncbi:MAG: hypothetical protein ACYTHJ_19590 [Planctomycetota bacterium]|jgi:hypothetical protein
MMSSRNRNQYWFSPKKFGWGWGPPVCWQGWVVMITYIVLVTVFPIYIFMKMPLPGLYFAVFMLVTTVAVILICKWKGPPARWRWGDESPYPAGMCQICGYDLTGNESGQCPECGEAVG